MARKLTARTGKVLEAMQGLGDDGKSLGLVIVGINAVRDLRDASEEAASRPGEERSRRQAGRQEWVTSPRPEGLWPHRPSSKSRVELAGRSLPPSP